MATRTTNQGRRGRPPGPAGPPPEQVESVLTRCKNCGSTDRTRYENVREMEIGGVNDAGPYTHVVWRPTKCTNCGQARVDVAHENRIAEK